MGTSIVQIALYALGGCVFGVLIGWSIQAVIGRRRIAQLTSEARKRLEDVIGQRDEYANEYSRAQSSVEHLEAAYAKRNAQLKSVLKKSKLLTKSVRTLRAERETTKIKVSTIQGALSSLRQQTIALQTEFDKTREFYKRELLKSLQKRKDLEEEIKGARAEQESLAKLIESSALNHGSDTDMVVTAQLRLGQLAALERTVNKLEAENAELRQNALQMKQELKARERDLAKLEELRVHNKQLVRCVEALEDSRKAHESDAERYRQQADDSEKLSDTLRLKLDDLEKNFADIEKQQHQALEDVRKASVVPILKKQG